MSNWKAAWALSWLALVMVAPLRSERVALVIGNGAYRGGNVTELSNPGNDARAVAAKLGGLGFEVTSGIDLGRAEFFDLLAEFGKQAEGAEAALLFYAGHGMQVEGENYLIPVDAGSLKEETDLPRDAVNLDYVLGKMKGKTNLVFLDACRNNPFRGFRSSGGRGLAVVSAESVEEMGGGVLISYAADPGKLALDGEGQNSPYTEALLKHMGRRGVSVGDMLTGVKADVEDATGGAQHPWTSVSMRRPFYFVPGPGPIVTGGDDSSATPGEAWEVVKNSRSEDVLKKYIAEHKNAKTWVALAEERLRDLQKRKAGREWEALVEEAEYLSIDKNEGRWKTFIAQYKAYIEKYKDTVEKERLMQLQRGLAMFHEELQRITSERKEELQRITSEREWEAIDWCDTGTAACIAKYKAYIAKYRNVASAELNVAMARRIVSSRENTERLKREALERLRSIR